MVKIEIEVDERELQEIITKDIAHRLTAQYSAERNMLKREIAEATRKVVYAEKQLIIDMVINRATLEITKKAFPLLIESLNGQEGKER